MSGIFNIQELGIPLHQPWSLQEQAGEVAVRLMAAAIAAESAGGAYGEAATYFSESQ